MGDGEPDRSRKGEDEPELTAAIYTAYLPAIEADTPAKKQP
jgi:hypothetical protein